MFKSEKQKTTFPALSCWVVSFYGNYTWSRKKAQAQGIGSKCSSNQRLWGWSYWSPSLTPDCIIFLRSGTYFPEFDYIF